MKSLLRVSTAGNVDDGKSTLIGRLLMETGNVPIDVAESIRKSSAKDFPGGFDYSLITDGLSAEQEQKITIDVAYRYFTTKKRQFILADTPGHVQYTRNMATGASTADVGIVLIDAEKGMTSQSRRHSVISSLLGINHLVVAINKMDLVGFSESRFNEIREEFTAFSSRLNFKDVRFLPVSALFGDNVTVKSPKTTWYSGDTLSQTLESIYVEGDRNRVDFRLPVQRVVRHGDKFRGYAGQVASGVVRVGDALAVLPSGFEVKVVTVNSGAESAECMQSATLTLDREVDISRGDVLAPVGNLPNVATEIESILIWFDEEAMDPEKSYLLKHGAMWTKARVEPLRYKLDTDSLRKSESRTLSLNEIGRTTIRSFKPLVFDAYAKNRAMGNFILVDPVTSRTAAAGIIVDRRSSSESKSTESTKLGKAQAKTILFMGLSGAGKSTIAGHVAESLRLTGSAVKWLDGDVLRQGLSSDLGFSPEARAENLRRMAEVAKLFNQEGIQVVGSFIAPLASDREIIRKIVGVENYVEVFVDAPLEVCRQRDPKGWYKKIDQGTLKGFTGVDSAFEIPEKPHLTLKTAEVSVEKSVDLVLSYLNRLN